MEAAEESIIATEEHVAFCFDTLLGHFTGNAVPIPSFADIRCPLFVTWNKESRHGNWKLRGCIGTLEPRQLQTALKDYSLTSALRDRRFEPISHKEVSVLQCTVSLLHGFERAASWTEWTLGCHGLIIEFKDPGTGSRRSATFLPEVAVHERWTMQQTVDMLIRKAGFYGDVTPHFRSTLTVTRYSSTTRSLAYRDYCKLRAPDIELHQQIDASCLITVPA